MISLSTQHDENELSETHEINVTPFIDVMLVLLIIFMIAAPLATVDIPVDLPPSTATPHQPPSEPLYLTLKTDLTLALNDRPLQRDQLIETLRQSTANDVDQRIYLRADQRVEYGHLITLLDQLRDAGFVHIALMGVESGNPGDG